MSALLQQQKRKQRIDNLIKQIQDIDPLESKEIYQFLCRYLCIRLIAYLDMSIRDILQEYCIQRDSGEIVSKTIDSYLQTKASNLQCTKIVMLLDSMHKPWGQEIRSKLTDNGFPFSESKIPSQISSLKGMRDKYAHGDESNANFTTLKESYASIEKLLSYVQSVIV